MEAAAAQFHSTATLDDAEILKNVYLYKARFQWLSAEAARIGGSVIGFGLCVRGPCDLIGLTVTGDLNLHASHFFGVASLENISVGGSAHFHSSRFERATDLSDGKVKGRLKFSRAQFKKAFNMVAIKVDNDLLCDDARFYSRVDLSGAQLRGDFDLTHCLFLDEFRFQVVSLSNGLVADKSRFCKKATFIGTHIDADCSMSNCNFYAEAEFQRMKVGGNLYIDNARFWREAEFVSIEVGGDARVAGCHALKLNLNGSTIRKLQFAEAPTIGEINSSADKSHFVSCDLRSFSFQELFGDLVNLLKLQQPFDSQPFYQVEKYLKRIGESRSADEVYYLGQSLRGRLLKPQSEGFWDNVTYVAQLSGDRVWRFLGYGVRNAPLVLISIALILAGTLLFIDYDAACMRTATACVTTAHIGGWNAFWLSLRTFLPIDILAPKEYEPSTESFLGMSSARFDHLASALKILGWILIPILVANLAGFLRRSSNS